MEDDLKYLSWFLGPKAENGDYLLDLLNQITRDYIHWRKNYFPNDKILITKKIQRENSDQEDNIYNQLLEIVAELRRNFPFYSPRYMAHMLSDVMMPSILGYFAGMLYNPNNVTPEAAPVTTEWEIDACNELMKMIGYKPSPIPPSKDASKQLWMDYQSELKKEFGWAHISSGGTVANIEALWVARTIKYFPLAIQDIAIDQDLSIEIKLPDDSQKQVDIKSVSQKDILNLKSNESIYLLAKYIAAYGKKNDIPIEKASKKAFKELDKSQYSLSANLHRTMAQFPPVIFVAGTAHYSINKAADILGIGKDNVEVIDIDADFSMDIDDLRTKIDSRINKGFYPLAVISIVGTTEEGAVDPTHKILDLREEYEKRNISFWLHADAAWGGFISTVLNIDERTEFEIITNKIFKRLAINTDGLFADKIESLYTSLAKEYPLRLSEEEKRNLIIKSRNIKGKSVLKNRELCELQTPDITQDNELTLADDEIKSSLLHHVTEEELKEAIDNKLKDFKNHLESLCVFFNQQNYDKIIHKLKKLLNDFKFIRTNNVQNNLFTNEDFELTLNDRVISASDFVSDDIVINWKGKYNKTIKIKWNKYNVIASLLALKKVDSVTLDPHKMGYSLYPCGAIAFKNDRIRHFIKQEAPYITSAEHKAILHNPPRHIDNLSFEDLPPNNVKINIDSFCPFILEGSKPGAVASGLLLSIKTIPLNRDSHGLIVKQSILAAREFYEWMINWKNVLETSKIDNVYYDFIPLHKTFPHTNIVIFVVKLKYNNSIEMMNKLTREVYERFTIQAELGSKEYSYSQPFFLSNTKITSKNYNYSALEDFLYNENRCNFPKDSLKKEYSSEEGIVILRATLMNPYIIASKKVLNQNFIKDFISELHDTANKCAIDLIRNINNTK